MRRVLLFTESRYKVNRQKLRETAVNFLAQERLKDNYEVSIAIVGNRKMRSLNKKYRQEDKTTAVLAFPLTGFIYPNDGILRLGDVVISYPEAVAQAAEEEMLVDEKLAELLIHGLKNLIIKV